MVPCNLVPRVGHAAKILLHLCQRFPVGFFLASVRSAGNVHDQVVASEMVGVPVATLARLAASIHWLLTPRRRTRANRPVTAQADIAKLRSMQGAGGLGLGSPKEAAEVVSG
jgi:hypothetical protein